MVSITTMTGRADVLNALAVLRTDLYMQTAGEHQQAITLLVKSDLFRYYSERMIGMIMAGAEDVRPHSHPRPSLLPANQRHRS